MSRNKKKTLLELKLKPGFDMLLMSKKKNSLLRFKPKTSYIILNSYSIQLCLSI